MEQPRITGTEMEWGIYAKEDASSKWAPLDIRDYQLNFLPKGLESISEFLTNGGRYYIDYGNHLEYCTPEDQNMIGTVTNEIAGEKIVLNTLDEMIDQGLIRNYWATKRLSDDENNSWGHHENYSVNSKIITIDSNKLRLLGLHLSSRNIFLGAGKFSGVRNNRINFEISSKSKSLNEDFSNSTTAIKPVVNLRNQSLSNPKYNRIHVTSGDSNMSPWAMWMSLATTSIVLKLIENCEDDIDLYPKTSLHNISKLISKDLSLKKVFEGENNKDFNAINIQRAIYEKAKISHQKKGILNKEEVSALDEWGKVLDDLEFKPRIELIDRVEWIARLNLLENYFIPANQVSAKNLKSIDRLWDDIGSKGIAQKYRKTLWKKWMPSDEKIQRSIFSAPTTTRAKPRSQFILDCLKNNKRANVSWDELEIDKKKKIYLKNPFQTTL